MTESKLSGRDEIDHRIDSLIDAALDDLYEKLDRLRASEGLHDPDMVDRLRNWPDLADGYEDWLIEGGEDG